MTVKRIILGLFVLTFAFPVLTATVARAEESTVNKVKDDAGDTKTAVKKDARKVKRNVRQAVGTDSVGKDINDKAHDVGDDVSNGVAKAKRKTESN
jgi:hypothetical protein